ncbi:MAG: hypothetical protein FJ197_11965 [Gammaproteobacteria bacterium]|nr:hypothetical protein [Gammaproteobacteria bacterium]
MRKLAEFVRRLRWGTLEERRRSGLVELYDLLAQTSFHDKYWVFLGLMLGCVREGGPLPRDRDSDFAFLDRDLGDFMAAVAVLRRNGYSLRPLQVNNDGRTTKWALKRRGYKFEFFQLDQRADRYRWHTHGRNPPTELVNEVPAHGLTYFELYGRRFRIPDNAEQQLEILYGNWRQPDPDYRYWRDCQATIERNPWTSSRRRTAD